MADANFTLKTPCSKCGSLNRNDSGDCRPCKKITAATRYIVNKELMKAAANAWRAANPDKAKAIYIARYAKHSEQLKAASNAWNKANPEKVKASSAAWAKENPEARRIHHQNRRARKKKTPGHLSFGLSLKLFKLQKGMCPCCSMPLGDDFHMDHTIPLVLGGDHTDANMQLLRAKCNLQKHAKHPIEFMQSRGFLL